MVTYNATNADCFVYTQKEGVLSRVAHNLKLCVRRFQIDIDDSLVIRGKFDASSLEVLAAVVDGREDVSVLSARDRETIEEHIRNDVLHSGRHPAVEFASVSVQDVEGSLQVRGNLSLHGVTHEVAAVVEGRRRCRVALDQRAFGIEPFRAMMGALRVQPVVGVEIVVREDGSRSGRLP